MDHFREHLRGYHGEGPFKRRALKRRVTVFDATCGADPSSENQVELTCSGLQDTKLKSELQDRGKAFQEASVHFDFAGHRPQNKEYQGAYLGSPEDSNQVKSVALANMALMKDELVEQLNRLKVYQRY